MYTRGRLGTDWYMYMQLIDLVANRQLDVQLTQAENEGENEKELIYVRD